MAKLKISINNREFEADEGQTVLDVARANGIYIPTLCYHPKLSIYGGCRVCMVEVKGAPKPVTSCTMPVTNGMEVTTDTDTVRKMRQTVVELLLSDHPLECPTCDKGGECTLQDLTVEFGIKENRFYGAKRNIPVEEANNFIRRDYQRCILCTRCTRMCDEVQGGGFINVARRGFHAKISTPGDKPLNCEFCGQCVDACPVGALTDKMSKFAGRSWEMKKTRTTCTFCGVGCTMDLHAKDNKVVRVTGNTEGPVNEGSLCIKGRYGYGFIHNEERIKTPLIRKNGELVPASWDEAIGFVAAKFTELKEKYGPHTLGVLSSARCTNEENYMMQKFGRAVLGTGNIDNCARVCHAPSVAGLAASFGTGAATNNFDDIKHSDLIFVIGANPTEAHPIVGLKFRRSVRKGVPLIVGDPRKTELAKKSNIWLNLLPGTNIALLNGMCHVVLEEGLEDREFIKARTEGFEAFRESLKEFTPEYTAKITGVPKARIIEAARMYAKAKSPMIFYGLGMTEHITGSRNVQAMANLVLLCGHVGRPVSGLNALRGQNNVQGACDMGALPNTLPGYQNVTDPVASAKFSRAWGIEIPKEVGLKSPDMIDEMVKGNFKGLYVLGEDPAHTDPNVRHVIEGLKNLELLVVQELFHTETTKIAHVVFPAASFAECDGTFTNGERRVQRVRKAINPIAGKANWQITAELATRMGYPMSYNHASEIWDEMASLSPMFAGINFDRIDKSGLQWPCPSLDHPGTPVMYLERFSTPSGLGNFAALKHQPPAETTCEEYPLILTTVRQREHYNNASMTRRSKPIGARWSEESVWISPMDAESMGIKDREMVRVASKRGEVAVRAKVTDRCQRGIVSMTFHYAETNSNLVTNNVGDATTKTPEYKACAVRIERV